MTWLLGFVWNNKKGIALGLLALVLFATFAGMRASLNSANREVAKLKSDIELLQGERESLLMVNDSWRQSYDHLGKLTAECNASVERLAKASDERKKKAAEALKNAEAISAQAQSVINASRARESAKNGTCEQAVADAKRDLEALR